MSRILRLRRGLRRGPHRLAGPLGHPRSTIDVVLRRHRCSRLRDFDRVTSRPLRYVRERAGALVHMDVKKLGVIPPGGGHRVVARQLGERRQKRRGYDYVHVAVDDVTRVAFVEIFPDEKAVSAVAFLRHMHGFFAQHGVQVERLMTDGNPIYRRAWAFRDALAELGIQHRLTRPDRPQTNGKAERFIQTLLGEWAYFRPYGNNPERLRALPRWVRFYNCRRPHSELGDRPPLMTLVNKVRGNYS